MNQYQNLKVWQKAREMAVVLYKATATFPAEEKFGLTSQLRRSAVSVASNIAEGAGRNTHGEFIQFLGIATGSAYELETQLVIANDLSYPDHETFNQIQKRTQEKTKMLYSLRLHLNSGQPKKTNCAQLKTKKYRLKTKRNGNN